MQTTTISANLMFKLDPYKLLAYKGLYPYLLRILPSVISQSLTRFFKLTILNGIILDDRRTAIQTRIHNNRTRTDTINYRMPISLFYLQGAQLVIREVGGLIHSFKCFSDAIIDQNKKTSRDRNQLY